MTAIPVYPAALPTVCGQHRWGIRDEEHVMMWLDLEFNLQLQKPHYHRDRLSPPITPVKGGWGLELTVALLDSMCPVGLNTPNPTKRTQINLVYLNRILNPVISFQWCRVAACLLASKSKLEGEKNRQHLCPFCCARPLCACVFCLCILFMDL